MRPSSITTNTGRSFFAATVDLTGPLRPPETITAEEMRWDTEDVNERRKMHQWVKLGGYSLFLWWALIGGIIMVYMYSVAGYAYLHGEFLKTGKVPTGADVAVQMATVAGGVLGGMAHVAVHHGHPL